jgi:hypothetical protein
MAERISALSALPFQARPPVIRRSFGHKRVAQSGRQPHGENSFCRYTASKGDDAIYLFGSVRLYPDP